MGILTRPLDDKFVITSDRTRDEAPAKRAPARLSENYAVWTGSNWSDEKADALAFTSLDAADEYVRANFAKVTA